MKKKRLSALALLPLLLAALLAVGTATFMGPCGHGGSCDRAGEALTWLGGGMAVLCLAALLLTDARLRLVLYGATLVSSVFAILTPGTLVALCGGAAMRCRQVMQPAAIILSSLILLFALVNMLAVLRRLRKEKA